MGRGVGSFSCLLGAVGLSLMTTVIGQGAGSTNVAVEDDLTVFVNANLLRETEGAEGSDSTHAGVALLRKIGLTTWEECAHACSERTCCSGFVFISGPAGHAHDASCNILLGPAREPPSPSHHQDGAVSGLMSRPVPAQCAIEAADTTQPESTESSDVTLVTSFLDGKVPDGSSTALSGLVALLELELPLVLVTHPGLLQQFQPLLHARVHVVLVRVTESGELENAYDPEGVGREGKELPISPSMRAMVGQWRSLFSATSAGACGDDEYCHADSLVSKEAGWHKVGWIRWSAQVNPWSSAAFLWVDLAPCAHLLSTPLDLRYLDYAVKQHKLFAVVNSNMHSKLASSPPSTMNLTGHGPRMHTQVLGGSRSTILNVTSLWCDMFRAVLSEQQLLADESEVWSLVLEQAPEMLHTISSSSNIQGIDMADSTCWSVRIFTFSMPSFQIQWPVRDAKIAPEEAVLLLKFDHLYLSDFLYMWHEQRNLAIKEDVSEFETTSRVQVCFRVAINNPADRCANSMVAHEDEEQEGWSQVANKLSGVERPLCTVGFQCGDDDSLWLGELASGRYSLEVQLQTLHGQPITSSQETRFEIHRLNEWLEAPAGLCAAPKVDTLLDMPAVLASHGICEDESLRVRCGPDAASHEHVRLYAPLKTNTHGAPWQAVMGLSLRDKFDSELATIAIRDWLRSSLQTDTQLFLFDISAPLESAPALHQNANVSTDSRHIGTMCSTRNSDLRQLATEVGCTPQIGCHVVEMWAPELVPLSPLPSSKPHFVNLEEMDEGEASCWTFGTGAFAFVYLSSGGEGRQYAELIDSWLPAVRIGGYLAGSGYFSESSPTIKEHHVRRRLPRGYQADIQRWATFRPAVTLQWSSHGRQRCWYLRKCALVKNGVCQDEDATSTS